MTFITVIITILLAVSLGCFGMACWHLGRARGYSDCLRIWKGANHDA
jgi:hypothetical protein